MDKKKSLLNVSISIIFKILLLVLTLLTRRILINTIGNDANGINSLYTSLIGFLGIAELGVGSAITFCMYKPIAESDNEKISSLYNLFVKVYRIIGIIILVVGLLITPVIPYLAKDYSADFNLYSSFILMLVSIAINYVFSAKTSLINAYKNNYVTTTISSVGQIIMNISQILVLYLFKSFDLYMICRIFSIVFQWIFTNIYFNKHHKMLIDRKAKLSTESKKGVSNNIRAMFMHKIGGLLVDTSDSLIISAFISVAVLGKYSNYTIIMTSMTSVLVLFFTPLTSIIGHLCAEGNIEKEERYFNFFYYFNFIIGCIFFLGYYSTIDNLVTIFFGDNLELTKDVSFVITLNYFIKFLRNASELFKDATGCFYYDRFKPLFEGVTNVILSITLVHFIGVTGVIVATIITTLLINNIVEPYVLFHHAFNKSPIKYYIKNYSLTVIFLVSLIILHFCMIDIENVWTSFFVNGFIAVGIALISAIMIFIINKAFRHDLVNLIKEFISKIKKGVRKED